MLFSFALIRSSFSFFKFNYYYLFVVDVEQIENSKILILPIFDTEEDILQSLSMSFGSAESL